MLEYFYRVKRYFNFDRLEQKQLVAVSLVFGFSLAYGRLNVATGAVEALNIILSSLMIAATAVLTKETAHKLMAIKRGYTVKMSLRPILLVLVLVVSLATEGGIYILLPATALTIYHHERMRIGEFRYGHNYLDNAVIAFFGPLANVYLALFFRMFSTLANPNVVLAMEFNLMYAVVSLIPIDIILFFIKTQNALEKSDTHDHPPPVAGTYIVYSTKIFYVSCATVIGILAATIYVFGPLLSTFSALIAGLAVYLVLWYSKEFNVV